MHGPERCLAGISNSRNESRFYRDPAPPLLLGSPAQHFENALRLSDFETLEKKEKSDMSEKVQFEAHLLDQCADSRTIQVLLDHADIRGPLPARVGNEPIPENVPVLLDLMAHSVFQGRPRPEY